MSQENLKTKILKFLRKNPIMNISVSNNNRPISSVVLFHVEDDFTFYFATRANSYKARALDSNPRISFNIWEHRNMLIQADGKTQLIENESEIEKFLEKLASSAINIEDFWPPVLRMENDYYKLYKIKTTWMRALDLESKKLKEQEPPFEYLDVK